MKLSLNIVASVMLALAASAMAQSGSCSYWDGDAVGGVGGNNTLAMYHAIVKRIPTLDDLYWESVKEWP